MVAPVLRLVDFDATYLVLSDLSLQNETNFLTRNSAPILTENLALILPWNLAGILTGTANLTTCSWLLISFCHETCRPVWTKTPRRKYCD